MAPTLNITALLRDGDILLDPPLDAKSSLLATAAEHLGRASGIPSQTLLKALTDRDELGSTAINHGIAVPHAGIDGLAAPAAVMFRLERPIEFGAPDHNPVDLVFVLIWPSSKRGGLLATLGGLCGTLRDPSLLQALRSATSQAEVRLLLDQSAARTRHNPSG
jgi:nitrogen PTS system EIIA component